MNILVVSATELEVKQLTKKQILDVNFLITGIGVANTIFKLMEAISKQKYDANVRIPTEQRENLDLRVRKIIFRRH